MIAPDGRKEAPSQLLEPTPPPKGGHLTGESDKYQAGEPVDWKARLGGLKLRHQSEGRVELAGPCPRCGHEINGVFTVVVGPTIAPHKARTVKLVCNCTAYHHGAPVGEEGCGAWGWVDIPMSERIEVTSGTGDFGVKPGSVSTEEQEAYVWAGQAVKERLPRLRTGAEQWGATVSALTALLGTGTIIDSDDVVRSLLGPWNVLYGVVVGGALISAAASILFASRAAHARLGKIPVGATERLELYNRRIEESANGLGTSRFLAGLAVVLLVVSFAVRWYAPAIPASP